MYKWAWTWGVAVKICKQCLQTALASGGLCLPVPFPGLRWNPQGDFNLGTAVANDNSKHCYCVTEKLRAPNAVHVNGTVSSLV